MSYNCSWCPRSSPRDSGGSYDGTPKGWVWNKSFGFGRKVFCSNKCLNEYNEKNPEKSSNKSKESKSNSSDSIIGNMLKSDDQKMRDTGMSSSEIAAIKTAKEEAKAAEANASAIREQEYTKRKIAQENINFEKLKIKEEKIKQLRAEKKYVRVFAMEHPYLFGIASFVLFSLFLKVIMFFTTLGDAEKIQKSIDLSQNLEKIENQIILGINAKDPKEKLLELISQLTHPDTENTIEGKKRDVIDPDIPDSDFYGTFSEYWTSKREAYKNIVLKGLTLDEYLNKKSTEDTSDIENIPEETTEFTEVQDEIMVEGIAEKVFFYDKPNTESLTKGYFVKGQQAKLLGASGEFSKVRFEYNGKVTEKFVLTYQISEIDTNSPTESEEGVDSEYQETQYQGE